jgi:hypothetical protein
MFLSGLAMVARPSTEPFHQNALMAHGSAQIIPLRLLRDDHEDRSTGGGARNAAGDRKSGEARVIELAG